MKWIAGAAVVALIAGGGYYAWQQQAPEAPSSFETAFNDVYGPESFEDSPTDPAMTADAAATEEAPAAAPPPASAPRRAAPARAAAPVPEETIGVTPASVAVEESDEIVVTGARRPVWTRTPNARTLTALYPERALERGREGEASLSCTVQAGGALDCERVSETPGGFGNAALRVSRTLRHAPQLADGSDAVGTPVNLRVVFRIEDEPRRRG